MPIASIDFGFKALLQIAILSAIFLYIYGIFRGTRSEQMLWAAVGITIGLWGFAALFDLDVLLFLLGKIATIMAFSLTVIFQQELRQAFRTIGNRRFYRDAAKKDTIEAICTAVAAMSKSKIGALIAIERGTSLKEWADDAVRLDAPISKPLLLSIFHPGAPLHDGGVTIKGETVVAARCVFPLSEEDIGRGTRHRAALGLSERTDAVVVVVSEETGSISIACEGHMSTGLTEETLMKYLGRLVTKEAVADLVRRAVAEAPENDAEGGRQG